MTDKLNDRETKAKPPVRKFPVAAYADRIRLKAPPRASKSKSARLMFDILAKKKVAITKATDAIRETLDAAANAGYAALRQKNSRQSREQGRDLIDELNSKLNAFAGAISKLPPNSKSKLNRRMADVMMSGVFDTEIFIELVDCLAACLPQLFPKKLADDALLLLLAETSPEAKSPIVGLWEAIPSKTRSRVERELESRLPMRGVALLRLIPELLDNHRLVPRLGAPTSPKAEFVIELDRIWRSLGLTSGRQYDAAGGAGHKSSPFQQFGDAALAAVGNESRISDRQVDNLKRKRSVKSNRPSSTR
jgi:hypothetical protein